MKNEHGLSQTDLEVMAEHHSKLSVAQGVMQECFMPMIDPPTKINLISQVLYNRRRVSVNDQELGNVIFPLL
jgi:predicted transcriptional regulator